MNEICNIMHIMNIKFDIRWICHGKETREIEPVFFELLKAIRETGSLRSAAMQINISYRHAWGMVRYWTSVISKPIVILEKGRGATLSPVGEKLLWAEQLVKSRATPILNDITTELDRELSVILQHQQKSKPVVRINASHGLAIAELQSLYSESSAFNVDFHFKGSLESLRELANSRCEIAGFHFPVSEISEKLAPLYLQWLSEDKHLLLHVSTRQQGLMIQKNNPHKIRNLQSLAKRSVRFVNRQPESGTRTIFDELLKKENIDKSGINGYQDEEFTHIAVAALVASGAANAGFGIKAAAAKFNLEFIPIITESYLLAIDRKTPGSIINELIKILKSRRFKSRVNTLPGYDVKKAGEEITFDEVFGNK